MVDYVQPLHWDQEARETAVYSARQLSARDPEAASLLIAQVVAEEELSKDREYADPFASTYNPALVYDRACREYGWRPRDIDEMHYLTFFAMLREANKRHKEENESYKG
jgi:hypothetical protein